MRKKLILALLLSAAMTANVFAAQIMPLKTDVTSSGALTTSSQALDVWLEGEVQIDAPANIISVLMPTHVYFNLNPEDTDWNKVDSPVVNVSNLGASDVRVSVTKAVASGTTLTVEAPVGNEVRLGIAPDSMMDESLLSSTYLLRPGLSDASFIDLGLVSFAAPYNVTRLRVFGDAVRGAWNDGDVFAVQTVFKVTL